MIVKHLKTGNLYVVLSSAVNATNAQDGQRMIAYRPVGKNEPIYVRDETEFYIKFKEIRNGNA